jgi:hypothetical protein
LKRAAAIAMLLQRHVIALRRLKAASIQPMLPIAVEIVAVCLGIYLAVVVASY